MASIVCVRVWGPRDWKRDRNDEATAEASGEWRRCEEVKLRIAPSWVTRASTRGRSCVIDNDMHGDIMEHVQEQL